MQQQRQHIIFYFTAPCRIGVSLALFALMTGCIGNHLLVEEKNNPVENQKPGIQAGQPTVADAREARIDFDAAIEFIKAGEYDRGIELLNKVTAIEKNSPVPYINLAIVYGKVDNLKLAEENLKRALNIDPQNPVASNEYALLYRKTGRFSEARHLYERILKKYPGFYMARRNLGILCDLYMRDYECALKQYEIYTGAVPGDKTVKIWIADVKKRLTQ